MTSQSLAELGLKRNDPVKPPAAIYGIGQASVVAYIRKPSKLDYSKIQCALLRTFVRRLNEELEERNWSDNDLARHCGVAEGLRPEDGVTKYQSQITRIARQAKNPGLEMVQTIADGLGIGPLALFTDDYKGKSGTSTRTVYSQRKNSRQELKGSLRETGPMDKLTIRKKSYSALQVVGRTTTAAEICPRRATSQEGANAAAQ